ncbi:MAG: C10 family peptidase [Bacteroidales bacterium]|nr:C10 family peptidase [Bacteroidales bacterium]
MKTFILLFMFIAFGLSAQDVSLFQIEAGAEKFFKAKNIEFIPQICTNFQQEYPDLVFIQNKIGKGFIVTTKDKMFDPIVAYSEESDLGVMPPSVKWYFNFVQQQIELEKNRKSSSDGAREAWSLFLRDGKLFESNKLAVAPLLATKWNQDCYYNELCPEHVDGPCGHCYAGCVATAMGQVMKFHAYPVQGQGSHIYGTYLYPNLSANFGATTYLWDSMPSQLTTNNIPVATLLFHCGVSVNMDYGPTGSGSSLSLAAEAFKTYFKYANYATLIERNGIDDATWAEIMQNELLARRPLVYAGCGNGGCHAFVVDGIDASGRFHINWGWGGAYDGYYSLSNFNPGSINFNSDQRLIVGLEPAETDFIYCPSMQVYTNLTDTIEDGSGSERYGNNSQCAWLIQPPGAGLIYIHFTKLATEKDADEIKIYQGTNTNAQLVATISGYEIPTQPILVWGNAAYITFSSDDILRSDGFSFYYTTSFVDLQEYARDKIHVYPNPANDEFFVDIPSEIINEGIKIELYNSLFQKVYETMANQTHISLKLHNAGTFFVKIYGDHFSITEKIMVFD